MYKYKINNYSESKIRMYIILWQRIHLNTKIMQHKKKITKG